MRSKRLLMGAAVIGLPGCNDDVGGICSGSRHYWPVRTRVPANSPRPALNPMGRCAEAKAPI